MVRYPFRRQRHCQHHHKLMASKTAHEPAGPATEATSLHHDRGFSGHDSNYAAKASNATTRPSANYDCQPGGISTLKKARPTPTASGQNRLDNIQVQFLGQNSSTYDGVLVVPNCMPMRLTSFDCSYTKRAFAECQSLPTSEDIAVNTVIGMLNSGYKN